MKVIIKNVKYDLASEIYIIYFDYLDKLNQYTKVTTKTLNYWRYRTNNDKFLFNEGQEINIFKVPNSNMYKIIEVYLNGN